MSKELFSLSLFGFNQRKVLDYIAKLGIDFDERLEKKEKEISNLKNNILNLNRKIDSLNLDMKVLQDERQNVSNAIIVAQKNAEIIINEAKKEAHNAQSDIDSQIQEKTKILRELQIQINNLKLTTINSFNKFTSQIEKFDVED